MLALASQPCNRLHLPLPQRLYELKRQLQTTRKGTARHAYVLRRDIQAGMNAAKQARDEDSGVCLNCQGILDLRICTRALCILVKPLKDAKGSILGQEGLATKK